MPTIINNPSGDNSDDSGAGIVLGVILAIVIIALFIIYALPALRAGNQPQNPGGTNINVTIPSLSPSPSTT